MGRSDVEIITLVCQLIGGALLIGLGITSYALDRRIVYKWGLIYLYYILLGVFLIIYELKLGSFHKQFAYLSGSLGKSLFSFVIAMFTFYWWHWLQTLTFCYFFVLCLFYRAH